MNLRNASLLSLSVAGLLAGAPAMAQEDTYTGCVTPFGTIAWVAPGDVPLGGRCPWRSTEIKLGGSGGSATGSVRDVETVVGYPYVNGQPTDGTVDVEVPKDGVAVAADCPAGKQVISGGGSSSNPAIVLNESAPNENGTGWNVVYVPLDASSTTNYSYLHAYAICATVE